MTVWELLVEAMRKEHERGREWLSTADVVRAVEAIEPGTNRSTIALNMKFHCINDPSKKHSPGLRYLANPRLITDDSTLRGKRYRVLTDDERDAFLRNPRTDLEAFSYTQVVEWLRDPTPELAADDRALDEVEMVTETADELEIAGPALLELHLQDYLFRNWGSIFPGLRLYNGAEGREFRTTDPSVGIIDFLCTDDEGRYVVVETKRAQPDRQAIGQITGYMGLVANRLAGRDTSRVRGMLIAGEVSDALRMAVATVPDLELWLYELSFLLRPDRAER